MQEELQQVIKFTADIRTISGAAVFYRLRMADNNEKFVYSNSVSLHKGAMSNGKLKISANPASASTVIRFNADSSGNTGIVISNAVGCTIFLHRKKCNNGNNNFTVSEIANLPVGIYTSSVIYGNQTIQERLVVRSKAKNRVTRF